MDENAARLPYASRARTDKQPSRILLFDNSSGGHHGEFMCYLIMGCQSLHPSAQIHVAINAKLEPQLRRIADLLLVDISSCHLISLPPSRKGQGVLRQSLHEFFLLRSIVRKIRPNVVYVDAFIRLMIGYPLFWTLPRDVRISGTLYAPLGERSTRGFASILLRIKRLWFGQFIKARRIGSIYLLNARERCRELNDQHRTSKFIPVPDPIMPLNTGGPPAAKKERLETKLLMFGDLRKDKGTFLLLDAIGRLSPPLSQHLHFAFVGRVAEADRHEFETRLAELKRCGWKIDHKQGFLPYDEISPLMQQFDCVLLPYLRTDLSSGVLGHAAHAGIPVLSAGGGLLGQLVKQYGLGVAVDGPTSAENWATALTSVVKERPPIDFSRRDCFLNERTPQAFWSALVGNL